LIFPNIHIRSTIEPDDLGYIIQRHGKLYAEEYDYSVLFEAYVAGDLYDFYKSYDPTLDRMWICEHEGTIIGSLLLVHRGNNTAQLRYFYLEKAYRGIGLGKKLMELFMDFYKEKGYTHAYLWTTDELAAAASLYKRYGFVLTEEKRSAAFGKEATEQRYDLGY
jgi:GNAT superfamily N-acetyltransferase